MILPRLIAYFPFLFVLGLTLAQIPAVAQDSRIGPSIAEEATTICIRIASLVASGAPGSISFNQGEVQVVQSDNIEIYRGDQELAKSDEFTFRGQQDCVERFLLILRGDDARYRIYSRFAQMSSHIEHVAYIDPSKFSRSRECFRIREQIRDVSGGFKIADLSQEPNSRLDLIEDFMIADHNQRISLIRQLLSRAAQLGCLT